MQKFIMLVGLPGSGKSTYAKDVFGGIVSSKEAKTDGVWMPYIASSDSIRKELYGDESIQGNPSDVFALMQNRTIEYLKNGSTVIYDATGIKRRDRLEILNKVKSLNIDIKTECHVLQTNVELCIERNNNRERVVPGFVILRMASQFETPSYDEGWDTIKSVNTNTGVFKIYEIRR